MTDVETLENELKGLPEGWIVMLETSAAKSLELGIASIKFLTDAKMTGLILSANRPYSNLMGLYQKHGINADMIYVIDCITGKREGNPQTDKALFLEGANALTTISYSMNQTIENTHGKRFVFIDSITTMLIYNNPETFAKFAHNLLTKMRLAEINGLLISLETETSKEIRAEIGQLCDKIIRI